MPALSCTNPVTVCAVGEAALMAALYAGLGRAWTAGAGLSWGADLPHQFLVQAVTLDYQPRLPAGLSGPVRDSWAALDMPSGWTSSPAGTWMYRATGPCPVDAPPGVAVVRCHDAELFERTAFLAAGGSPPTRAGELHPAGSELSPGLHLLLALADERPVGTALAVVHPYGIHVSAIAVLPRHRGRGIGSSLVAAALRTDPALPATLLSGALSVPLYRRLGFVSVGAPVDWTAGQAPTPRNSDGSTRPVPL